MAHLSIDERLALNQHGNEGRSGLDLFQQGEHLLVLEDGKAKIKGSGDSWDEIESGELSRELLHRENHLADRKSREEKKAAEEEGKVSD